MYEGSSGKQVRMVKYLIVVTLKIDLVSDFFPDFVLSPV